MVQVQTSNHTISCTSNTGGLLNTISGVPKGGESVESKGPGDEESIPAVKRRCVRENDNISPPSGLEMEKIYGESGILAKIATHETCHHHQQRKHFHQYRPQHIAVQGEPATQPRHVPYKPDGQHHHCSSHSLPHFHPAPFAAPKWWRPPHQHQPIQQHIFQPPNYLSLQLPLEQPSYQSTELSYYQPSSRPLNPHQPTSATTQPCYQTHYQVLSPFHGHFPIHQLFHTVCSTVFEVYADFLRSCYVKHQCTSTKWPYLDAMNYINLAVISNEHANKKELVRFRQQTIHGSIDDILEGKAPIDMKDILKPNYVYENEKNEQTQCPVTQLLIEGAPGIGKSTFAWEVCQKWGQHQLFNEYTLVVLLKFRDKRMQEAKCVSDLFYYPLPELQCDIVNNIVLSGGHGLLLILEGFDEAPASKRMIDSIFVRLFMGQELPKATVILTTRPSASAGLRKLCKGKHSRRIEIVGFGKKEINEYIHCAFSDEQSRSDFKEYISLYPHIHSMMYVPLNCGIIADVYQSCKSSGTVVPKTMTQLYSSLVKTLLLCYLTNQEKYKDTCTSVNSFKDLPQPVYDQFCEICKIAYTGIMSAETELIFQDLPSDFDTLGLMQTCPELYVDSGASVSYNFLHFTLQEYLAAYHIFTFQSRNEQVTFMRKHIEIKELEVVVRFLAGLSGLGRDVVKEFANVTGPDVSKLWEKANFTEILHWLFESQDLSAITSVLGTTYMCIYHDCRSTLPFDLYVLGCCVNHSSCNWKIELSNCNVESVEIFLKALNFQHEQCQLHSRGQIKEIWLYSSNPAAVRILVDNMSQTLVFHNLTHLGLMHSDLTSETFNILSKHTDLLQHLEYLNLAGNSTGEGGAVNLITSLFSTIKELHLQCTDIGFDDCKALRELLASSKYIQVLNISVHEEELEDVRLSPDSVQLIVDGLFHNTSLEKLYMRGSKFSSENMHHLASVLRVNSRLKELDIACCNIQSSDSVHLAKALEEKLTTQLQTLWLWGNPIGLEGAGAFADMLTTNKSLAKLDMSCCNISREGAVCLAKAMERNATMREFDVSGNPVGSVGAESFATMLKKNKFLKKLVFVDGSVGVEGALELIESMKHNATLEKLRLSYKCKPHAFFELDKVLKDRVMFL